jgi:hypothetical protein
LLCVLTTVLCLLAALLHLRRQNNIGTRRAEA